MLIENFLPPLLFVISFCLFSKDTLEIAQGLFNGTVTRGRALLSGRFFRDPLEEGINLADITVLSLFLIRLVL